MPRAMVFIDGTWLRINIPKMAAEEGFDPKSYRVHFGKMLDGLKDSLAKSKELRTDPKEIDIVRPYIFGHVPINVHDDDRYEAGAIESFYDVVEKEFGYDAQIFELNCRGRHIDDEPPEKRVDVAMASSMLYYAAIPYAYDIAVAVLGDEDFVPVLQKVRSLGRRVAIASIRTAQFSPCSSVYTDEYDEEGVRDFDVIWLNDLAKNIEMPERIIECQAPDHVGGRRAVTRALVLPGRPEYCDECRARARGARRERQAKVSEVLAKIQERGWPSRGGLACGVLAVKKMRSKGPIGFIQAVVRGQQNSYYFDSRDLVEMSFDDISEFDVLVFRPEVMPPDYNCKARDVRKPTDSDWTRE